MHWMNGFWGGGWMMILWWVIIIVAIVALVKGFIGQKSSPASEESPPDILKKRYARGEIGKEEFESSKSDILD
jgi:putative membrane protein